MMEFFFEVWRSKTFCKDSQTISAQPSIMDCVDQFTRMTKERL